MRFTDFRPVHVDDVDQLQDQLEPGTPDLWVELATEAFSVLASHPTLQAVGKRDLAQCAISAVFQIVTELGGQSHHFASAERAFYLSMKGSRT